MNAALAIITAFFLFAVGLALLARRGRDMDLEQWTAGGRGFGAIFVFLLMAGEIYSTFTFLGGAGLVYGSGGAAYYILGYGTLAYILSYWLLPAVWRYCTPRKLLSQADFFVAKYDSRSLGVIVSVVGVAAMIPYLALQLKGLGIIVSEASGTVSSTAAVWIGALVLSVYVVASGIHGSAWTACVKDVLTLAVVVFIGLYLPIHYFGSIGGMFHQVQEAKPGFAALKGDQLSPVWFSSTVLLTALGFYMWPHTFGSALTARNEDVFRRNAIFMPLYQLLIAFVLLVGFVAVLRLPGLGEDQTDVALLGISQRAFPDWFVGLIGSAGMLCALVPGSMLLIASSTIVARNIFRALNPSMSDAAVTRTTKLLVPVIGLAAVAFVFQGGQTIVTLLLLGYALVTQVFPALVLSLVRPGGVTKAGAIAGIVVGEAIVAAMSFSGATPGSSTTLDSLVGGLPAWLADLNLGVVALLANVLVTCAVSAATRGSAPVESGRTAGTPRFSRAGEPAPARAPQR
jgi:solute:Na+ symporter, SSS family